MPLETQEQRVSTLNATILNLLDNASKQNSAAIGTRIKKIGLTVKPLQNQTPFMDKPSRGWAIDLDRNAEYEIPDMKDRACNGIMSKGLWFTEAHIETGGDESISHVARGNKVFKSAVSTV